MKNVLWFDEIGMTDLPAVGGKNASLGEMVSHLSALGVRVPGGFATTADAYRRFLAHDGLGDQIAALLRDLDTDDVAALTRVGGEIRASIERHPLPEDLEIDIRTAYDRLLHDDADPDAVTWAVRSSSSRRSGAVSTASSIRGCIRAASWPTKATTRRRADWSVSMRPRPRMMVKTRWMLT